MRTSEQGIALIKKFEGFSAEAYICPAGKTTIGYGHVIKATEKFPGAISSSDAELLLKHDIFDAEQAINRLVKTPLKQCEFDALASLVYNIGIRAFQTSTILRLINGLNMGAAAGQFNRWIYAGSIKLEGLVKRRQAETDMFLGKPPI